MVHATSDVAAPDTGYSPTELENIMHATYMHLLTPITEAQRREFMKNLEEHFVRRHERGAARRAAWDRAVVSVRRLRPSPRRTRRPLMAG